MWASTSDTTVESLPRIQRSASVSSLASGTGVATVAPLDNANRVAFHNFVQKLREPAAHSSASAMSAPGLAPLARVKRVASAPNRSIQSSGSMTLPRDFDIFLPWASRISPCR